MRQVLCDEGNAGRFCDIYMLIESSDQIEKLRDLKFQNDEGEIERSKSHATSQLIGDKGISKSPRKMTGGAATRSKPCQLRLSEIADLLTGYGRIVEYAWVQAPVSSANAEYARPLDKFLPALEKCLLRVEEGKFRYGHLDSYGRVYSVEDGAGTCAVGFFTNGSLDGKGEVFDTEGNVSAGIWTNGELTKEMDINNYQTR